MVVGNRHPGFRERLDDVPSGTVENVVFLPRQNPARTAGRAAMIRLPANDAKSGLSVLEPSVVTSSYP
jgi:hypothetical protein